MTVMCNQAIVMIIERINLFICYVVYYSPGVESAIVITVSVCGLVVLVGE